MRWALACALLVGCGRLGYDLEPELRLADSGAPGAGGNGLGGGGGGGGNDASVSFDSSVVTDAQVADVVPDADRLDATFEAPIDAPPDSGNCVLGPFSAPVSIGYLGLQPSLYGPRLSRDGLTMFFSQTSRGTFKDEDIFVSRRPNVGTPFGTAAVVTELVTKAQEGTAFLLFDDRTLYFSSERGGGVGGRDIWVATRPTPTSPFGTLVDVTELDSTSWEHLPSFTGDGLVVFFSSDRTAAMWDIFTASRPNTSTPFSTPVTVAEVSQPPTTDTGPFITPDGLTLYFVTNVAPSGVADFNIWMTTRADRNSPFGAPVRVDLFNSTGNDQDPYLTADGLEFYFSTDRGGNGFEIYRSVRSCQ